MDKPQDMRLQYMKRLVGDLYADPIRFDRHPLGDMGIADKLTRGIDVVVPEKLKERASGIQEAIRILGILTLGSLKLRFAQSRRDEPLRRYKKRRENMTPKERELVGLIILWFKYIEPTLRSSEPLTDQEAINAARLGLKGLMEGCQLATQCEMHLKWIVPLLIYMYGQGESGTRSVINYQEQALDFLLRQIVKNTARVNLAVGDVLPELASDDADATQILTPTPEATTSAVVGGAVEWEAQLARCVTDYRTYELQEIERLLREQGLVSSFDWFLSRQACRPANQAEVGEDSLILDLADICKPELRIALSDIRGSGTTTALLWLSNRYCRAETAIEPLMLRIDARDYADAAVNDIAVCTYLAEKMYGRGRSEEESRENFEETLDKAQTICLVDNLSRVKPEDQVRIGRRLRRFAGVVFVAPWTTDEELAMIGGQGTVRATLELFEKVQVHQFIIEFGIQAAPGFDEFLAQHLACDMPDIAALPLGLAALCEQVCLHRGDCVSVAQQFVTELFLHSEKPAPDWRQGYNDLPPELGILGRLAVSIYNSIRREPACGGSLLTFNEDWALGCLLEVFRKEWPDARTSPLLVQIGPQTYRFLNQEIFGFLVAMASAKHLVSQCPDYTRDMFRQDIVDIANRYYYTWLENDVRCPRGSDS